MIIGLSLIAIGIAWLLYETNFQRVRLQMGVDKIIKPARYVAYNSMTKKKHYTVELRAGSNVEEPDGPTYTVVFNPGITEPLCGWEWLDKHVGDLVDYQPRVQMAIAGVRYDMTIKAPGIMDQVMKANKLSKQEKLKYS